LEVRCKVSFLQGAGMFKKFMMTSVILAGSAMVNSYAGNLYLGPTLFVQDNIAGRSNYRGLHPRMSLGYADSFEDFYLSGEIFAVPFSATLQDNGNGGDSARTTRTYGASLLPGAMITQHILGYVRLGVVTSVFSGPNTSRAGAQMGLGLQTCLTPYWDLRAEYNYTTYRSAPDIGAIKSDQMGVGLIYKVIG
jgi:hypothetical protein